MRYSRRVANASSSVSNPSPLHGRGEWSAAPVITDATMGNDGAKDGREMGGGGTRCSVAWWDVTNEDRHNSALIMAGQWSTPVVFVTPSPVVLTLAPLAPLPLAMAVSTLSRAPLPPLRKKEGELVVAAAAAAADGKWWGWHMLRCHWMPWSGCTDEAAACPGNNVVADPDHGVEASRCAPPVA